MKEIPEVPEATTIDSLLSAAVSPFDLRRAFELALAPAGAPNDDDDGDDDAGDDAGDDDDGDDASGDDNDGNADDADDDDSEAKLRSREAAKYRTRAKSERQKREAAEAELQKLKDKDGDAVDVATRKATEAEERATEAETALNGALFEAAFAQVQLDLGAFKDPKYVRYLLDQDDDVQVEDGEVVGLTEAVKALVKKDKSLLASAANDSDDDGDDDDEDDEPKRGKPSGRATNGRKSKKGLDKEALQSKFPALRARG